MDFTLADNEARHCIQNAITLLRQAKVELYPWIVQPAACLLWGGNFLQRWIREKRVARTEWDMVRRSEILVESDGKLQLPCYPEAEPDAWKSRASALASLLLQLAATHPKEIQWSLVEFGYSLYGAHDLENAIALWQKGADLAPDNPSFWSFLGVAFEELTRFSEAEKAFRRSLACENKSAATHFSFAVLLVKVERYAEAEQEYRRAI